MFFAFAARLGNRSRQRAGYCADPITRAENGFADAKASNGATANCPVPFLQHRPIFLAVPRRWLDLMRPLRNIE